MPGDGKDTLDQAVRRPVAATDGNSLAQARSTKRGGPAPAVSACDNGNSLTVSTRPTSESGETEPVIRKRPEHGSSPTAFLSSGTRPGARTNAPPFPGICVPRKEAPAENRPLITHEGEIMSNTESVRAWKFLRRNPGYIEARGTAEKSARAELAPFPLRRQTEGDVETASWGLLAWEDTQDQAGPASPFWTEAPTREARPSTGVPALAELLGVPDVRLSGLRLRSGAVIVKVLWFFQMKFVAALIWFVLTLSLAACGGSHLSVDLPEGEDTLELSFPPGRAVEHPLPFRISGGIPPYESSIEGCPDWVTLFPDQGVLAGTAPVAENDRTFFCTFSVTESDPGFRPARTVTYGLRLNVGPLDRGTWRFRTRTVEPGGPCTLPNSEPRTEVAILPHALGGETGEDIYDSIDFPHNYFLHFNQITRELTYIHPPAVPILGTPNTYRYLVGDRDQISREGLNAKNADDVLCLDVQFDPGDDICSDPEGDVEPAHFIHIHLRVRDDAYWDEKAEEYRCPDRLPESMSPSRSTTSNPVHTALAPVHARRAADVAHVTVRDRVRGWSPGAPRVLSAITPSVGLASLSGRSGGFDYTGSSESLSAGAELGSGSWQAGLVASVTRTDLHYRAPAGLAERGYLAGEHDTEILSLHPFAAWHMPSGGHLWASLGAGMGRLRHRDDVGFPSWSRSDVRLRAHAVGAALPIADVLSGELEAEAGIESFAFEIEGGDRISSTLPTMRGRDYRAGLAWSAPISGAPSLSVAYKHLTGDGPEGGQLEANGSVSVEGIFDPRLTVTGNAEGSFGLGDQEHDSWGLGGGVRFAPGEGGRGFGLSLDTRLASPDDGGSSDVGIRGEAGYGLWRGSYFGTVRPYVGLIRYSSDGSLRRTLGVDLHDTRASRVNVEIHDRPRDQSRVLKFTLDHRF